MKALPLVSIVTPSYNSAHFIVETIESVRSQDYPSIEHIIIDGGSTDGTLEILKNYTELRWISEPDGGQSEAINKGFRQAKGEIIGWLNADDTYESGAILSAVEFLRKHPDVDLIYSECRVIDEKGQFIRMAQSGPFDLENLLVMNHVNQPTVFMRRNVLQALGGVDENLKYIMDRELWLRVGLRFKIKFVSGKIFANFRLCEGTKSYEHASDFHKEWLCVLEQVAKNDGYGVIDPTKVDRARRKMIGRIHLARFIEEFRCSDNRSQNWRNLWVALQADSKLIMNLRTCRIILAALLKPLVS